MLSSRWYQWLRHPSITAKRNLTVDAGMTVARSTGCRKARKSKRWPLLLELLEHRLAPAVIVLDSVRTYDSREAIVDFEINTSTLTRPFDIQIFRSDVSFYSPTNPNNVPVGNPKAVTELSQGHHDNFTIDLSDLESVSPEAPLGPDPKLPYVLAVADPRRTLPASITIDNSQAHFRIYIIADVTQGFGPTKASWVSDMVGQLQAAKYDSVQRFDWNTLDPTPDETVKGGDALYDQLIAQANKLMVVKNVTPYDAIDVQLIGHSRGTAVVGRAMRDLTNMISTTPIQLARGYYKLTLLDPHPANSNTLNDIGTITTNLPIITYGVKLLALDVMEVYALLENAYKDPPIVVDHRVNQVEDYYQQNAPSSLSSRSIYDNPLEAVFNLLGDPSQVRIQDALDTITTEYNLTSLGLGHSDVWKWYMDNVIEAANPSDGPLANGAPPPWLGSSGGSSPPPSDLNLEQVLSQFVLDEGLAHELVNLLTTASDDLAQGNVEQSISDLESFDGTLRLAPDSDFLNGTFDLLQIGQNLIDDLGPVPSTSTGTIYWTGDAGRDAVGDSNWDQPGNWSTVDPLVDNVRQEILPGPLNDVVVDRLANIIHSDDIYDTISSLTVTDGGFINLNGGTLDLSGSGAPGIFHVPGTIILSNFQYGNVHLNGGVLANADVTKETSILVFGSPTVEQAERLKGVIKGGVLNGTIVVGHAYRAILELEGSWVNNGTITSHSGKLILGDQLAAGVDDSVAASDAWVNNGTISTENTAVELGGWLSYDPSANNLATLDLSTDSVYLIGTLDNTGGALAFGPGVTSGTGSWDLYGGRIDGGTILFFGGSELLCTGGILDGVTNDGTIDVTNAVTFEGQWTNAGTITIANGATANLGGVFTTDTFNGLVIEAGAFVYLTGRLDNSAADNPQSGGILALNSSTGPLFLEGGSIVQGRITTDGSNDLVATPGGGILSGVTLDGTLDMTQFAGAFDLSQFFGSHVFVLNGLTLNGTIELGGAAGTSNAGGINFGFPDDNFAQTISGSGTIQFGQDDAGDVLQNSSYQPLTFGPNITVQGGLHSYINAPHADIVNQGTIKNTSGGSLTMPVNLINAGTLDAGNGALSVTNFTQTATGVLAVGIGGTSQFGHLAVTGKAILGGTLRVALVNGYSPSIGDSFQIMTFSRFFGDFAATNGLDAGGNNQFDSEYSSADLTLTVTNNGNAPNPIIYWTGDAGDNNWDTPGNWSYDDPLVNNVPQSQLPRPIDNVVINLPHQTINHSAPSYDMISNLTVTGMDVTLNLSGGTLDFAGGGGQGILQVDQSGDTVNLQGTDLKSVVITSGTILTATSSGGVLDNVQLDGILDMTLYNGAFVQVVNAVTVNGTIELGGNMNSASLFFGYPHDFAGMTVTGTGTIEFGQSSDRDNLYNLSTGTLIFGSKLTIVGGTNSYLLSYYPTSGAIDNQGTIEENTNKGQLTINLDSWVNNGSIAVGNGATATLEGQSWSNSSTGKITVTDATLNLSGSWTNYGTITVDPSTISLGSPNTVLPSDPAAPLYYWSNQGTLAIGSGSTVNLGGIVTTDTFDSMVASGLVDPTVSFNVTGALDNSAADNPVSGGVLALGAATGSVYLAGGTIYQGTITTSGNNDLVATASGGTLDGVQLDGTLDMSQVQTNRILIINGLTLNGIVKLGGIAGAKIGAKLHFGQAQDNLAQTISGSGSIQFGQEALLNYLYNDSNKILTFGPDITVQGGLNSQIGALGSSFDNQGTIVVDGTSGGMLSLDGDWINDGSIEANNGGNAELSGSWSNSVSGRVTATDAILSISGYWTNYGTITVETSTVSLYGKWINYGAIAVDTSTANLGSANIDNDPNSAAAAPFVWTNFGTISIANVCTVNLGGVFNSDFIAYLQSNGTNLASDIMNLTGTMDNSAAHNVNDGGILALNASTGPLYLAGGRIYQGEITTNGNNDLIVSSPYGSGTLDGVHLVGTLDMAQFYYAGATVLVLNGLTLDGTIVVGRSGGNLDFGYLFDTVAQTIDGTGTIQGGRSFLTLENASSKTLTIGPNITIKGGTNTILEGNSGGASIDNQGTIIEDIAAGAGMTIVSWVNDGSIEVSNGAILTLEGQGGSNSTSGRITATGSTLKLYDSWTNYGTIAVDLSTISLGSPSNISPNDPGAYLYDWSNHGTLSIGSGSTVNLGGEFTTDSFNGLIAELAANGQSLANDTVNLKGTLDNSVAGNPVSVGVLALNASTGPLYLAGGRIYQGVITTSGGDLLATAYDPAARNDYTLNTGWLDGVTLNGTLDMTRLSAAVVLHGLTLNGTIIVGSGSTLWFGAVDASDALTVAGTGIIQIGLDSKGGRLKDESTALTIGPNITIQGGLFSVLYPFFDIKPGSIEILGTVADDTNGGVFVMNYYGFDSINDFSANTLTGGTWEASNGGSLWLVPFGHNITSNAATLSLSGAGSGIYSYDGKTDALAGFTTNTSLGNFTVANGYSFTAPGDFTNAGAVTVGIGGMFSTGTANYIQSSGATTVDGVLSAANISVNAGSLSGTGTIQGNLTSAATVSPGGGPGTTVQGSYTQSSAGVLDIVLGGTNQYSQLTISGNAVFDGTLNVTLLNGYMPRVGDSFTVLTFASHSGDFATEIGLDLGNGKFLKPVYDSGHLTLVVTNTQLSASIVTVNSTGGAGLTFGQSVTFTVSVIPTSSSTSLPTGSVQFQIDGNNSGNPAPLSGGSASFTTSTLSAGNHVVQVVYNGDGNFAGSIGTLTGGQTVMPLSLTPSPTLVGYQQYAVGSDTGGPSTVTEYNPDGSIAATFNPFPRTTGGVRTAVADFNGDGIADIAVGTGPGVTAEVVILDGKTGAVLFRVQPFGDFTGGVFVAAGNILGNRMADLVITPDVTGGPRVEVYEGGDFKEVANFFGIDDPSFRGGARAAVGDFTGDGRADLVISAGFGGGPRISVYDGAALLQGQLVHPIADFFAFESALRNGAYLAMGDVNGDGLDDLVFGAGLGGGPRVLVVSGRTLLTHGAIAAIDTPIANFLGGDLNTRSGVRVAVKNLDGDQYADLLTGSGQMGGSGIITYLGKNLTVNAAMEDYKFDAIPGFTGGVFVG